MSEISIPVGGRAGTGYLAVPDGAGPRPGVVIVFEATGASADMRAQAARFAERGYLALLPDLYGGRPWIRCVTAAMRQMRAGRGSGYDLIEASRRALAERDDCTGRVGVVGFCMGGGFALVSAARYDFDAAAVNYGMLPRDRSVLRDACPVVASYGGRDRSLPGAAAKLAATLDGYGVDNDVREYPDAGHSFLTESTLPGPSGPLVRMVMGHGIGREHAPDAWERIFGFLDGRLGGAGAAEPG